MAKVKFTALVESAQGRLGNDLVLKRTRSGATILAKKPEFPKNRKFSKAQREHQQRFKRAVAYAKIAQKNPIYVALAKKQRQPAYNVALGDYLHPPKIVAVECHGTVKQAGGTIRVYAEDTVKVERVTVALLDKEGQVLTEGEATPDAIGWWWTFTASQIEAARVRVCAWDLPGNKAMWEGNHGA